MLPAHIWSFWIGGMDGTASTACIAPLSRRHVALESREHSIPDELKTVG